MDGRWKLAVAGSVILSSIVGCSSTPNLPELPTPPSAPNSVFVPEPADEANHKDGPLASSTVILFANGWVESVAKDPNKPAAEREECLTRARQAFQEILAKEPKNVDALLGLGHLYHVSGETQRLNDIQQKAVTLHAGNPTVWVWVAKRQAMSNQWDAAIVSYNHAVRLDPDNRTYRKNLAFTLARSGRYADGYEAISRCMKEAEARYNIAMVMAYNGDVDKARMELRLALQADPNFSPASDKLATLPNQGAPNGSDVRTVGHNER